MLFGLLLAAAVSEPAPRGFFVDLGAGGGGCGGDGCVAADGGGIEVDVAGGWALRPWVSAELRVSALIGKVDFVLGSAELLLSPLAGTDSPVELYVAAGPAFGSGGSDFGPSEDGTRRAWVGLALSGRVGARFPTSWGGVGIFGGRVFAFGRSDCTSGVIYYYSGDVCADSRDVAPQFWTLGADVAIFP